MSFWDVIWFIAVTYLFFAYLMLLFAIIGDLFRDKETSGVLKAVWIFFLIFAPFVTALIYVVARHEGMRERAEASAERKQQQQDDYIRRTAGQATPANAADQIAQARALLDAGAISQQEYEALKSKALV